MDSHSGPKPVANDAAAPADAASMGAARRVLVASLRDDLLPLAESLDGYCQMLVDAANGHPDEFRTTVDAMQSAARGLYAFVRKQIDPTGLDVESSGFDERLRSLRHELGNRLNQVLGYCQLLLMDREQDFFGPLAEDLNQVKALCNDGAAALLRHKRAAGMPPQTASDSNGAAAAGPWDASPMAGPALPHQAVAPATILVVDDSPTSRDILTRILEREGHRVEAASSGREALSILAEREFDLVLLDFIMPEMNGYRTLMLLKSDERLRHTPVIIVSALDTMHEVAACIEIGAEDFLTKPVDLQLLRARTSACLEKKRLREREFGQFFTPELARHFVRHPELLREGRDATVSVLFCDIRAFSRSSEMLGPGDTVRWLSDVMGALSDCVIRHRGVLVDYIGDELMAMWGAPEDLDDHADLACEAALDMLAQLPKLNDIWQPILGHPTRVGIGINSGAARVGNTGSHRKFKYGPLGSTVNLASRVEGATKQLGATLLITENTLRGLRRPLATRRLCKARVVNIAQPVDLFEIPHEDLPRAKDLKQRYEQALTDFENQNVTAAAAALAPLLVDCPNDAPSRMLLARVSDRLSHPSDPLDTVWDLAGK